MLRLNDISLIASVRRISFVRSVRGSRRLRANYNGTGLVRYTTTMEGRRRLVVRRILATTTRLLYDFGRMLGLGDDDMGKGRYPIKAQYVVRRVLLVTTFVWFKNSPSVQNSV